MSGGLTLSGRDPKQQALDALPALEVFGHSLAGSQTFKPEAWSGRLAAAMGVDVWNYGSGGAALYAENSGTSPTTILDGGWPTIMQVRNQAEARPGAPYAPGCPALLWYGNNDLPMLGPAGLGAFVNALRAAISRCVCAEVWDDDHATVTKTGTWGVVGNSQRFSSGKQTSFTLAADDGSISIAVPADFPGGTVVLGFITPANGDGGLLDISVDGGAAVQHDTRNTNGFSHNSTRAATGRIGTSVKRLTGLAAGAHTITINASTITGVWYFDWWGIEADPEPLVVVARAIKPPSYNIWNTWPYSALGDADVDTLNGLIDGVVAEFGDGVITWDPDEALNSDASLFISDGVHPNETGLALLAEHLYEALRRSPALTFDRAMAGVGRKDIKPHVRVQNTLAATTVAHATVTELPFNAALEGYPSPALFWSAVTISNEFRCHRGGLYEIKATMNWPANATGIRDLNIKHNGTYIGGDRRGAAPAGATVQTAVAQKRFAPGEKFTIEVLQTSTVTLTIPTYGSAAPVVEVVRLSD